MLSIHVLFTKRHTSRRFAVDSLIAWVKNLLTDPSDVELDEGPLSEVYRHLAEGKKALAIRAYREATGVGLKEAKAEVDEMCEVLYANSIPPLPIQE